ncbi:hypothetical protein FHS85_003077 [Rhodoligotrophos appendicifer]
MPTPLRPRRAKLRPRDQHRLARGTEPVNDGSSVLKLLASCLKPDPAIPRPRREGMIDAGLENQVGGDDGALRPLRPPGRWRRSQASFKTDDPQIRKATQTPTAGKANRWERQRTGNDSAPAFTAHRLSQRTGHANVPATRRPGITNHRHSERAAVDDSPLAPPPKNGSAAERRCGASAGFVGRLSAPQPLLNTGG